MKLAKRKIKYTEMNNGTVENILVGKYNRTVISFDKEYDAGDTVTLEINPEHGYMRGLIYLKEESTGNDVPFEFLDTPHDHKYEIISFKMPNDNVTVSVHFSKMVLVVKVNNHYTSYSGFS